MTQSVKNLLSRFIQPTENWKITLLSQWRTIIGTLHDKVHIEKIERDTVTLGVIDSCWMHELQAFSSMILTSINQTLDQPRIKKIRFKKARLVKVSHKTEYQAPVVRATRELTSPERQALTGVQDKELQEALRKFRARCVQVTSTWKKQ